MSFDERRLPPLLRCCWYNLNQAFRRRIAHLGITPNHYTILRWLEENPEGLTQRQIADLMASDANTITAIITRMAEQELLSRRPHHQDGRAHLVTILEKGRALMNQAHPIAVGLQEEVMGSLPQNIREEFLDNLAVIAQACQNAQEEAKEKIPNHNGSSDVEGE